MPDFAAASQRDLPSVLLIGEATHPEFARAVEWLSRHTLLRTIAGSSSALEALQQPTSTPDVIIFAQARPGEFSGADVEHIHRAAPLSRLVALLGSWCEGEARTGKPWPGVTRIYWHQWIPRALQELLHGMHDGSTTWALPRTATQAEYLLQARHETTADHGRVIAVETNQLVHFEGLAEACQSAGYSAAWIHPDGPPAIRGAALALLDASCRPNELTSRIGRLVHRLPSTPVLVLLDFPRLADLEAAYGAGAAAVLAKPFLLNDLLVEMRRIGGPAVRRAAA